ncbi:MAG: 3-oxoacyl-[acyl-carrier-protein] reductase [Candidatus Zixiibacteriota bacterium]|jgi:3-oxoacyl-[acyl-carrier protein] reductase
MPEFENKVAVVTGGARGIGRAIAARLARDGASLALCDVLADEVEATAAALAGEFGVRAKGYVVDVSDGTAVSDFVAAVNEEFGSVDILVNNAGIARDKPLFRMKDEDFDLVMRVNLYGAFHFCRAAGRIMAKQRAGKIINISSVIGVMGNPTQANYAASKAGIIGLTKTVAKELAGRGVNCNAIAPGFIMTEMTDILSDELKQEYMKLIPAGRYGTPEDVAKIVAFLASEESSYITGHLLYVDGGMMM